MRRHYISDIREEQFKKILPILESARKKTRPRQVDLYEVFCAILYLLKSGCQWAMLPSDFPAKSTVYHYFKLWKAPTAEGVSLLEQALKKGGWRGPREQWSEREHDFFDRGRAKREEHR